MPPKVRKVISGISFEIRISVNEQKERICILNEDLVNDRVLTSKPSSNK